MKIGAVYPQIELKGDPVALDHIGRGVEELGYDHLSMYDHVVGAEHADRDPPLTGVYNQNDPFHDPFVAFAYLAGVTKTLEFTTSILILPQRQTALVAKQATDVQLLSGGRLRIGAGIGWNHVEYKTLGVPFAQRGKRQAEQIKLLRRFWTESLFSFEGEFHTVERACIIPRPKEPIPIYCGGFADAAFKRAAKIGDGFIFALGPDAIFPAWEKMKGMLEEEGRSVSSFGADMVVQDENRHGIPVDDVVDRLKRWQDVGGTHASVVSMGRGFTEIQQHMDYFAEVKQKAGF